MLPALEAWSINHGTIREVPSHDGFKKKFCHYLGTKEKVFLFVEHEMSQFSTQTTSVPTSAPSANHGNCMTF